MRMRRKRRKRRKKRKRRRRREDDNKESERNVEMNCKLGVSQKLTKEGARDKEKKKKANKGESKLMQGKRCTLLRNKCYCL
jgi:hypothetical protein